MQLYPKFSTSILKGSIGALIGATALFALVHLCLKTPLSELVMPWLLYSGLGVLMTPFVYWSRRHEASSRGDWRPLYVTLGVFFMIGGPLLLHYASKFGLFSPSHLPGLYLTVVFTFPPIFLGTYYLSKRFGIPPHRRDPHGPAEPEDAQ